MATISSESPPFLAGKKIIVAGAGIAGLSFVIALRKQWSVLTSSLASPVDPPTITIYERDSKSLAIEREGYSLSIRSDGLSGGIQALSKLGLLESLLRVSITGTQDDRGEFAIWDKDWNEILKMKARKSNADLAALSMRIARKALRQGLIDAVAPSDIIHWETSCRAAVKLSNGKVRVQCSNGKVEECDILIAADGANSKIRASLRPDDKLSFAGAVCISGDSRFPEGIPEPVNRDWGSVVGAGGVGLFVSPIDEHSAVWSLSYLSAEPRETLRAPISPEQGQKLLQEALDLGRPFSQPLKSLVQATDMSTLMLFNAMDKSPFPHVSSDQKGEPVIFIGDSNHAMSPFAGNGANMALMDGYDLAERLCKYSSLPAALAEYDALSMPRSKSAIRMSHWSIAIAHAQGWRLTLFIFLLRLVKLVFFHNLT